MMPVYRFRGFASGSAVALGASQGTSSGSASVPTWGEAHAGSVTVSITRSDWRVAPETISFEISGYSGFDTPEPTGTFDVRFHDFVFLWDFGDPGKTFPRVPRLRPEHNNANVAYGPEVAHTYLHGTYTASVLVIELSSGKTATWSQQITVADPDVFFTGGNGATITVHPTPGQGNSANLDDALGQAAVLGIPCRIQLGRDQVFNLTSRIRFDNRTWRNIYICAGPGAGAAPILRWNTTAGGPSGVNGIFDIMMNGLRLAGNPKLDIVFDGIRFEGPWNPETESGGEWVRWFNLAAAPAAGRVAPDYLQIHNCTIDGVVLFAQVAEMTTNIIFSNTTVTDWADYGAGLFDNDRLVFLGCEIKQNPNALTGGPKDFALNPRNMHGPVRVGVCEHLIMDGCDLFSNNGWSSNNLGYTSHQPCFRWGQSAREGDRANIQRTIMEGGGVIGGGGDANYGSPPGRNMKATHNVRVEKCYFLGNHFTQQIWETQYGGLTMRNNIAVFPNIPKLPTGVGNPTHFLGVRVWQETSPTGMDRVLVEHNTVVNLQAGSAPIVMVMQSIGAGVAQDNSVIVVRNNVLHQPNATVPQTDFAPLSTGAAITPFTINYRRRAEVFTGNTGATIAAGQSFLIPYNAGDFWATTPGTSTSYLPEAFNNTDLRITGFNSGSTIAANTYSLTYEAGGIRIRNDGASTWPSASFVFAIERAATALPPPITSVATPVSTGALYAPLLGSEALGLAGEADIRDDFFGDIRPQMSSYGALEAAD